MPAHKLRKGKSKATSPADGADGHTISSSRTQPPRAKASPLARIAPVAIVLFVIIAGFLIMKSRFTPGSVEEFDRLYGKRGAAPGEMQEFAYLRQFLDGLDGHKAQRAVLDKIATLCPWIRRNLPSQSLCELTRKCKLGSLIFSAGVYDLRSSDLRR